MFDRPALAGLFFTICMGAFFERNNRVGACIAHPCGTWYGFALGFGEYETFHRRTSGARPNV